MEDCIHSYFFEVYSNKFIQAIRVILDVFFSFPRRQSLWIPDVVAFSIFLASLNYVGPLNRVDYGQSPLSSSMVDPPTHAEVPFPPPM